MRASASGSPALLLCAALLLGGPALAQAATCRTFDACVAQMTRANAAKDYAAAQQAAEAAYALRPDPNLLYNLGKFQRKQGRRQEALDYYQRFLDSNAESLTAEVRAEVEDTVRKLRVELAPPPEPPPAGTPAGTPGPAPPPPAVEVKPPALPEAVLRAAPLRPRLGVRTYVGAPAAALGLGLVGLGAAALSVNGQCTDSACARLYDSQGQGLALLLPGVALVGAGVTLVGLDLARRYRRQN